MGFAIGLFTLVMVLDCAVLIFLILIQLPKKDAGAGLAFGGGATDALFGAGSGNVLTNITKYAAGTFFVLAVVLSIMQRTYHGAKPAEFLQKLESQGQAVPGPLPGSTPATTPSAPAAAPAAAVAGSNVMTLPTVVTPKPATPATNVAPVTAPKK